VKDESGQISASREFVTNQTHFIDRSLDPQLAYTYTVKAMLGNVSTQVSEKANVETYNQLMDDRDSRIQYGSAFGNWADSELFGGTEKFADLSLGNYTDKDATAFLSMVLALKSMVSNHLNWESLKSKSMINQSVNWTSILQVQLKKVALSVASQDCQMVLM
jgi:hypothetical protein